MHGAAENQGSETLRRGPHELSARSCELWEEALSYPNGTEGRTAGGGGLEFLQHRNMLRHCRAKDCHVAARKRFAWARVAITKEMLMSLGAL